MELVEEMALRRREITQKIQSWVNNHLLLSLLITVVMALNTLYFVSLFKVKENALIRSRSAGVIGESIVPLIPPYLTDDIPVATSIYH
jgi:hypothetical protein